MTTATAVTYGEELLSDELIAELMPLLHEHKDEVCFHPDMVLDPDWETYFKIQANGAFRAYIARLDGALVGYVAYFKTRDLHYRAQVRASQDVLFVRKDYRGSRVGLDLLRYSHDRLKADGCTIVTQHVKVTPGLDFSRALVRVLKYEHVDHILALRLDQ